MLAEYSFVSRWQLPVASGRAWAEIERMITAGAPEPTSARVAATTWWPAVTIAVPLAALDAGGRLDLVVRSPLGYRLRVRLTVDGVEPGRALSARSDGDLRGSGRIVVDPVGDAASVVTFHWDVATRRPWMNATAWLLRPVFERAHARVMHDGERGMRAALEARPG
ncbi:hypothetical protein [Microbacterium sp. CFBP9034]|uniref:hypothetical protein n=1 Tax=Microbacterium sp. CFBP9034 TaxID=3096540 RepID=UPI002A69A750|nr:hypothetical protein [Microbacterium sp. CFBP9034]MDY0909853.1 hypothetical protein [Microbacterium sp. CFBP9034]